MGLRAIGPYDVLREVGRGSFGRVFAVRDPRSGRTLALKLLSPEVPDFVHEAAVGTGVRHPNVLGAIDVGYSEGARYLVAELATGGTVRDRMGEPSAGIAETRHVLVQVARALHAIHDAGRVHRDLKPENVLFAGEGRFGRVWLSDFGTARPYRSGGAPGDAGSPAYMAPEQIRGRCDPRADLYGLAVIAYELLAGRRPFDGDLESIVRGHLERDPALETLPAPVRDVLARALAKDPEARPRTAYELWLDLDRALARIDARPMASADPTRAIARDEISGWEVVTRCGGALLRGEGAPTWWSSIHPRPVACVDASAPFHVALRDDEALTLVHAEGSLRTRAPLYGIPPLVAASRFSGAVATNDRSSSSALRVHRHGARVRTVSLPSAVGTLVAAEARSRELVLASDVQGTWLAATDGERVERTRLPARLASWVREPTGWSVRLEDGTRRAVELDPLRLSA